MANNRLPARRTAAGRPARPAPRPRDTGKVTAGTFTYMGDTYRLDTKMGVWPLLQFARAAQSGFTNNDSRGLAAIHAFLQDVMDPRDWGRFQEDMIAKKMADINGLLEVVRKAVDESLAAMEKAEKEKAEKERLAPGKDPRGDEDDEDDPDEDDNDDR